MKRKTAISRILAVVLVMVTAAWLGGGQAQAIDFDLGVSKVFFRQDSGILGTVRAEVYQNSDVYLELLQIDDYYRQLGAGVSYAFYKQNERTVRFVLGMDRYQLLATTNYLFRTGVACEEQLPFGEMALDTYLLLDDLTGVSLRYGLELRLPDTLLKGKIGVGNLLGSGDGYAVWVGLTL